MKKIALLLLCVIGVSILCESCASSNKCDAYRSVNRYRAERLR